jgi:hypothetical protein
MADVRDLWYRGLRRVTGILLFAAGRYVTVPEK